MAKVLDRMKNLLKRNPRPQNLPPGTYPTPAGNAQTLGTITKNSYQADDDDDDNEDIESSRNYNVPEQTRLKERSRNISQSDNITPNRSTYSGPSPNPLNPSNTPFRPASGGFMGGLPTNNNSNNNNLSPLSNTNINTAPNLPSRPGIPFLSQNQDRISTPTPNNSQPSFGGFPPNMNSNQPPPPNNPQLSSGGFPFGMNPNPPPPPPPPNNPQSSSGGFPLGMNPNPPPPSNNPQPSSGGFPPGMNLNRTPPNNPQPPSGGFPPGMNLNPPPNNSQPSSGGFPPGMNLNPPPPPNNPQSSSGGFPPGLNSNQPQSPPNDSQSPMNRLFGGMNTNQTSPPSTTRDPQSSSFPGFPLGGNSQPPIPPSNFPTNVSNNPSQGILSKLSSSFPRPSSNHEDNLSRLELDYPIENVLIDANIPSAIALKINDVVEQDRLGNAYHVHRYTFEPSEPQHISYSNNQHSHQNFPENSFHGGTRHIREIHNNHRNPSHDDDALYHPRSTKHSRRRHNHYSKTTLEQYIDQLLQTHGSTVIHAQNYDDIQQILNQQLLYTELLPPPQPSIIPFLSDTSTINGPVFYYTARALNDDPMRHY